MVTLIVFFVVFVEKFFEFLKDLTNDTVIKISRKNCRDYIVRKNCRDYIVRNNCREIIYV